MTQTIYSIGPIDKDFPSLIGYAEFLMDVESLRRRWLNKQDADKRKPIRVWRTDTDGTPMRDVHTLIGTIDAAGVFHPKA